MCIVAISVQGLTSPFGNLKLVFKDVSAAPLAVHKIRVLNICSENEKNQYKFDSKSPYILMRPLKFDKNLQIF